MDIPRRRALGIVGALLMPAGRAGAQSPTRPDWLDGPVGDRVVERFPPPPGHAVPAGGDVDFGTWLGRLPLRPPGDPVLLHDGRRRADQSGVAAVVDIDVGRSDLQQCADAIIRLRAEYLRATGRREALRFRFTGGDAYGYGDYLAGRRPVVRGASVAWTSVAPAPDSRPAFRAWLDIVFAYAGTISLARELTRLADPALVAAGDALIQPGSPGHAVLAAAVALRANHPPMALFVQSFMPAQSIHVLRGPFANAWHPLAAGEPVTTPDWRFGPNDWRRFPPV